jgi:hypothetical protein
MKRVALTAAAALLLAPAGAYAKGTNVRISSAPDGTDAGETWTTLITVTMPGNGRLAGVRPKVIVRKGAQRRTFAARPTGRRGVYRARVVFPARGRWRYGIDDGLDRFEPGAGRVHGFPAVTIGPGRPAAKRPPLPISGEVEEAPPAPLGSARGQLPPQLFRAPATEGDGVGTLALAIPPALAGVAGVALLGRRRRKRR